MRSLIERLRVIVASGPVGLEQIALIQDLVRERLQDFRDAGVEQLHKGPGRYLLYKDPELGFVIMMMVWGQGDKTPIHEHGTWGVEAVLKDTIVVTNFDADDTAPQETSEVILPEGSVAFVLPPDNDRHSVGHHSGDCAISIHVYGEELTSSRCFVPGEGFQDLPLTARAIDLEF